MAFAAKSTKDRRVVGEINATKTTKGTKATTWSFSSLLFFYSCFFSLLDNSKIFCGNDFRLVGTIGGDVVDAEARVAVVVGMEGGGFAEAEADAVLVRHVERVHVVVAEIDAFQVAHLQPALVERAAFVGVLSIRIGTPDRKSVV